MDEQDIREHRYRFFSEKGVQIAFEQDKLLVTLFTGILAGVTALLVDKPIGFCTALFFLQTALSALVGLAMCLLHMAFSAKVMALHAAILADEDEVPNLIARGEQTAHALTKNRAFAQTCYSGQLLCLLCSAFFAAIGIVAIVWPAIGWQGLVVTILVASGLVVAVVRPLLWVYHATRVSLESQTAVCDSPNE